MGRTPSGGHKGCSLRQAMRNERWEEETTCHLPSSSGPWMAAPTRLRQTSRGASNLRLWEPSPDGAPAIPTCGLVGDQEAPRRRHCGSLDPNVFTLAIFHSRSHLTPFPTSRLVTPMHKRSLLTQSWWSRCGGGCACTWELQACVALCAGSGEPAWDPLSLSLSAPPSPALSLKIKGTKTCSKHLTVTSSTQSPQQTRLPQEARRDGRWPPPQSHILGPSPQNDPSPRTGCRKSLHFGGKEETDPRDLILRHISFSPKRRANRNPQRIRERRSWSQMPQPPPTSGLSCLHSPLNRTTRTDGDRAFSDLLGPPGGRGILCVQSMSRSLRCEQGSAWPRRPVQGPGWGPTLAVAGETGEGEIRTSEDKQEGRIS